MMVIGLCLEVARPLRRGHDEAGGVVGLQAAVEKVEGLHHPARAHDVLHRHPLLHEGLGVLGGVLAVGDLHMGHLLGGGAVLVHVAHEGEGELLPGAGHPERTPGQVGPPDGRRRAHAGAADANLRVTVHGAEEGDRVAHAGLDRAHGQPDQRLCRGAPSHHVHEEVEADPQVAGHELGEAGVVVLIAHHAVDITVGEPGVRHGPGQGVTAMARVVRPELREYSVSPMPTIQYLSRSDFIGPPRPRSDTNGAIY